MFSFALFSSFLTFKVYLRILITYLTYFLEMKAIKIHNSFLKSKLCLQEHREFITDSRTSSSILSGRDTPTKGSDGQGNQLLGNGVF